jgi:Protein of unknown function (DUF3761)
MFQAAKAGGVLISLVAALVLSAAACGDTSSTPGIGSVPESAPPTQAATVPPTAAPTAVPTAKPTQIPTVAPAQPAPADPYAAATAAGASAVCADGSSSFSQNRSGTCSSHGGVHWWTGNLGPAGPGNH